MISSVYYLIFFSLFAGIILVAAFIWAVKSGQFKDVEEPKYQMMRDED